MLFASLNSSLFGVAADKTEAQEQRKASREDEGEGRGTGPSLLGRLNLARNVFTKPAARRTSALGTGKKWTAVGERARTPDALNVSIKLKHIQVR